MTPAEADAVVRRANAAGCSSAADYAAKLEKAWDALWEVAIDMRPYVPDYFAEKWHHDRDLTAAKEMRDGVRKFGVGDTTDTPEPRP